MLSTTILLWALNLSVTKYILTHGFLPLPYATVRYAFAGVIFVAFTLYMRADAFASSAGICRSSRSPPAHSG